MKQFLILFLVLIQGQALQAANVETLKLPEPKVSRLSNGLTVVWFERESIPVADLIFVSKAGYRNDPKGKAGVVELLSNMMQKGAGEYSDLELSKEIEKLGASRMVSADDDSFTVGMHGLASDSPRLLELLYKQVTSPLLQEADFFNAHDKILDRLNHIGDSADLLASLLFHRVTANGTDYFRAGFSSKTEFNTVQLSDVLTQYKRVFNPTHSILILVGRVKQEQMMPAVNKTFGTWSSGGVSLSAYSITDKKFLTRSNKVLFLGRKDLTQAEFRIGFRFSKLEPKERFVAAVFNALMGEYFNSRLNSILRDKLGLTYSVSSSLSFNHSYTRWQMSAATRNEKSGEFLKQAINIMKTTAIDGVTAAEVEQAKAYLLGSYPIGMSTLPAVASRWLVGQIYEMDPSYFNGYPQGVAAVSKEDVNRWIKKYFKIEIMTKVVSGDEQAVQKSLYQSGFGSIQKFQISDLLR